jgi:hypothetical protein
MQMPEINDAIGRNKEKIMVKQYERNGQPGM